MSRTKIHKSGQWEVQGLESQASRIFNQRVRNGIISTSSRSMTPKRKTYSFPKDTLQPRKDGLSVGLPGSSRGSSDC